MRAEYISNSLKNLRSPWVIEIYGLDFETALKCIEMEAHKCIS